MSDASLFHRLVSYENLIDAAYSAAAGRRSRDYVVRFLRDFADEIPALRRELVDGSYRPGPYNEFYVYDLNPYKKTVTQTQLAEV